MYSVEVYDGGRVVGQQSFVAAGNSRQNRNAAYDAASRWAERQERMDRGVTVIKWIDAK